MAQRQTYAFKEMREPARSFKEYRLRTIMKQREEIVARLIDLDFEVWVLEEFFRCGGGE